MHIINKIINLQDTSATHACKKKDRKIKKE